MRNNFLLHELTRDLPDFAWNVSIFSIFAKCFVLKSRARWASVSYSLHLQSYVWLCWFNCGVGCSMRSEFRRVGCKSLTVFVVWDAVESLLCVILDCFLLVVWECHIVQAMYYVKI